MKLIARCFGCGKLKLFPLEGVISGTEVSSTIEYYTVWICRRCYYRHGGHRFS